MSCKCFDGQGCINLYGIDRRDIDLNLKDKQIELCDYYNNKFYTLLKINYCPICGEKLGGMEMKGVKTLQTFDPNYFRKGDAFQLESTTTGVKTNALLVKCEVDALKFIILPTKNPYPGESEVLIIRIDDLKTTNITKLVAEEE